MSSKPKVILQIINFSNQNIYAVSIYLLTKRNAPNVTVYLYMSIYFDNSLLS